VPLTPAALLPLATRPPSLRSPPLAPSLRLTQRHAGVVLQTSCSHSNLTPRLLLLLLLLPPPPPPLLRRGAAVCGQQVMDDPSTLLYLARQARAWGVTAGAQAAEAVVWVCGLVVLGCVVDCIEHMAPDASE